MKIRYILLLAPLLFFSACAGQFEKKAQVMGTEVRVKADSRAAAAVGISEIYRLDRIFSRFVPNSDISRLNRGGRGTLAFDTKKALEKAALVKKMSGGAFDVRFGKSGKIDLGAIGKGYAIESARQEMLKMGCKSAIIDMHSSLAVIGGGWVAAVHDPRVKGNKIIGTIALHDGESLSTSGQYEQPGHIIDPRNGKPAEKCLSVTVVAADAGLADALSTAVFVLGPVEGMRLIKKLNLKALIVSEKGIINDNFGAELRQFVD